MTKILRTTLRLAIAAMLALSPVAQANSLKASDSRQASRGGTGILLLAHGGSRQSWNAEVNRLADAINKAAPVEVAFGMASKKEIQAAIDRLVARGVVEIVAVPLFISSHSTVITSTEYLLGLRATAPPELAIFAKMDHGHGGHGEHHPPAATVPAFVPTTPVVAPVPVRMIDALNRHEIAADILLDRAKGLGHDPAKEVVVVVAHGRVSDDENAKWLADMQVLVERMRSKGPFSGSSS